MVQRKDPFEEWRQRGETRRLERKFKSKPKGGAEKKGSIDPRRGWIY